MASTVKIFNITLPQKNSLSCAICRIVNVENDPLIYSEFHAKTLKCRQFLRETPQALAAPVVNRKILEAGGSIYIMVVKDLLENCTFKDHCDSLNIQMMDFLDPIPTYIYKACVLYTMEYKLAPQWNKVGLYLVEGPNFLSSTGNVNAIKLNIKEICDNSAQIQVEIINLKIPFLRLSTTRPSQHDDLQPLVRVLPSMKLASVLHISKIIKEKYLFKNYEDLRAYWKNMHGYILPDYQEGLLFYNIRFLYFKSGVFLYPETCLASGPLKILPFMTDPLPIIYKFAEDIKGRVIKLCEQQLNICPENTYQAAVLAYTPASRISGFSICDTGYKTQSRKTSTIRLSRMPDTCDIPTKRSRLLLPKTNDYLPCEIDDFDFLINPSQCPTNKFKSFNIANNSSAMLCDRDNIMVNESVVQDKSKSHYFEQKKEEIENQSSMVDMEILDKGEKPTKLNLKEKLLRNF